MKKEAIKISKYDLIYLIGIFVMLFIWALVQPYNFGPDDIMFLNIYLNVIHCHSLILLK